MPGKCSGSVWGGHRWYPCWRTAKVEREEKLYCGIHDPVAVNTKRVARYESQKAKLEAEQMVRYEEERRQRAGELGIELAKDIIGKKWPEEGVVLSDLKAFAAKAQAVVDALDGKMTCEKTENGERTCQ